MVSKKNVEKTFVFLAILNKQLSPGVYNKINGLTQAAKKLGFQARLWCNMPNKRPYKDLSKEIVRSEEKILFVRSLCQLNIFIMYSLFLARYKGKTIIIEVPTPNTVAIREILRRKQRKLRKIQQLLYLLLSGPMPYWLAHRVVQYADESKWFLFGNHSKTIKIGNGIDVECVPLRRYSPAWPSQTLQLIGVASVNYWHGFDRVIRAMKLVNDRKSKKFEIQFTVVGDGPELQELKDMVLQLNLTENVFFTGMLEGDALFEAYERAHLAIGSLGLLRKGLTEASELKAREYCAVGIPFLATGRDPDFPDETPFRIVVDPSDEINTLIAVFDSLDEKLNASTPEAMRRFAIDNLDYQRKLMKILSL